MVWFLHPPRGHWRIRLHTEILWHHKKQNCTFPLFFTCSVASYRLICTINNWSMSEVTNLSLSWCEGSCTQRAQSKHMSWCRLLKRATSCLNLPSSFNTCCTDFSFPPDTAAFLSTIETLCTVKKCLLILVQICSIMRYWHLSLVDIWYLLLQLQGLFVLSMCQLCCIMYLQSNF